MNKQQLSSKIWAMANVLRGKVDANDYKDYLLGLIFYKYLSENEEKFLISNQLSESEFESFLIEEDENSVDYLQQNIGYFISYKNLFSTWMKMENEFSINNQNTISNLHSLDIQGNIVRFTKADFGRFRFPHGYVRGEHEG